MTSILTAPSQPAPGARIAPELDPAPSASYDGPVYRVAIDSTEGLWVYDLEAESESDALSQARDLARIDGWDGHDSMVAAEILP